MINISQPILGIEEISAVVKVLESGFISSGKKVEEFEKKFAEYCGTRFAVATNGGTSALHAALLAVGVGKGDEVITTPFSFIATSNAVLMCGAKPVFVDIDPRTYNLDPKLVREAVTDKTQAILPVHLYGLPADMKEIMKIAEENDLKVVEDACQAHGASINKKRVGSFGTGCFSFYATKNMTTGEGGVITTNDETVYDNCKSIINHGQSEKDVYARLGFNYKMTELNAAIGLEQLKKLDDFNAKRVLNAEKLSESLKNHFSVPFVPDGFAHVFHQYVIKVKDRQGFRKEMLDKGVQTGIHYPVPIHLQQFYKKLSHNISFPVAEECAGRVVSLPVHPGLSSEDINKIIVSAI